MLVSYDFKQLSFSSLDTKVAKTRKNYNFLILISENKDLNIIEENSS